MPFKNSSYTGTRLFPITQNEDIYTFRVWMNHATSLERVFTFSMNKDSSYYAVLEAFGKLHVKDTKRFQDFAQQEMVTPKQGYAHFRKQLDSLDVFSMPTNDTLMIRLHQPFSMYVVEIKEGERYHSFKFYTDFPAISKGAKGKYLFLEDLLFDEIPIAFLME